MTIARTYLEMGLIEEAIPALRTAAKSRVFASKRLLRSPVSTSSAASPVRPSSGSNGRPRLRPRASTTGARCLYELGTTLEDVGETARALAVFLELQAEGRVTRTSPSAPSGSLAYSPEGDHLVLHPTAARRVFP